MINPLIFLAMGANASNAAAGAGALLLLLMALLAAGLWLWSLIDVLKRPYHDNVEKFIWVFVIVSTFFLGTVLYIFLGRKKK